MPSVYLCMFGLIAVLAIIVLLKKEWDMSCYYIGFSAMTLLLCLRFGQGTDYPSYWNIYKHAELALEPSMNFLKYWRMTGGEIGWQLLMVIFQRLHMDYRMVVVLISVVMMFCTHKAIVKYCGSYKTVALLILYPTAYLTYYFSGLRQGIVMTCFFGILLGWLLDKKYVRYVIGVLLLTSIHLAALIYLLVPIILCMNRRIYLVGTVLSAIFAICMYWDPIRNIVIYVAGHFGKAATYFGTPSISKFSLLERMLMLALVFFLIWRKERKQEANKECYIPFLKIYYAGFLLYICLCTNPLVSSRLAIMLKVVEFLLIPMLLSETEELVKRGTVLLLCIVSCGMSYKNLNSYIVQGKYKAGISAFNYPYVTVFNYEDILNYRESFEYEPFDFKEEELIRAGEF